MTTLALSIILINFIIVFIIEFSGIITDISKFIWRYSHPGKQWTYQMIRKPWSCGLCLTFWITLIYMLFFKSILIALAIASFSALCTIITKNIINLFYRLTDKINNISQIK